jgi:nucleotide-binding universal stress UspA family protein
MERARLFYQNGGRDMPDTHKILAASDLSEQSLHAASRAAMLCAKLKCDMVELLLVKEAGLPDALGLAMNTTSAAAEAILVERTMSELQLIARQLQDNHGIFCAPAVKFGKPEAEIIARADELPAGLTVIGARGGNFFTRFFLGNTADRLARMSKTPLLVVKKFPTAPYRKVLAPVDFSENSRHAASVALKVAPDAKITFLHAFDVIFEEHMRYMNVAPDIIREYHARAGTEVLRELNQFIADLQPGDHSFFRTVIFGHPGHVIYDHAKKMKPDLIVLGKHGRSRFDELLLGSVTQHVLDQISCDVLIVPAASRTSHDGPERNTD